MQSLRQLLPNLTSGDGVLDAQPASHRPIRAVRSVSTANRGHNPSAVAALSVQAGCGAEGNLVASAPVLYLCQVCAASTLWRLAQDGDPPR